jgi:hypothetical protein
VLRKFIAVLKEGKNRKTPNKPKLKSFYPNSADDEPLRI